MLPSLARSEWEDVFHQEPKIYTVTAVNVPLQRAQRGQASPPHEEINTHPSKKKNLHKNRGGEPEERKMATMDSKNRQQLIP